MTSRTILIHQSRPCASAFISNIHVLFKIINSLTNHHTKILYKKSFLWAFFQIFFFFCILWQQIPYILIINFDVTASNKELFFFRIVNHGHNMLKSSWNKSTLLFWWRISNHRMCFTTTLKIINFTVWPYANIVPLYPSTTCSTS